MQPSETLETIHKTSSQPIIPQEGEESILDTIINNELNAPLVHDTVSFQMHSRKDSALSSIKSSQHDADFEFFKALNQKQLMYRQTLLSNGATIDYSKQMLKGGKQSNYKSIFGKKKSFVL